MITAPYASLHEETLFDLLRLHEKGINANAKLFEAGIIDKIDLKEANKADKAQIALIRVELLYRLENSKYNADLHAMLAKNFILPYTSPRTDLPK